MPERRLSFPAGRTAVLELVTPLESERVPLAQAAGRRLADDYYARETIVAFDRSAMDGYALRAAQTAGATPEAPTRIRVASEVAYAGHSSSPLPNDHAISIATGAPVPSGADAVVPIEDVVLDDHAILIREPISIGEHVFPAGDDARIGDAVARIGDRCTPGRVALLASAGFAEVAVYRQPRVAIVSTGDELVPVEASPRGAQVRNSNAAMLAAALELDGARVISVAHASDTVESVRAALARALEEADLVITSGGASVGERDLVKATFRNLGVRFAFDSLALRPAKPTAFGHVGDTAVAVLPGNPAAAYVAYLALARAAVGRFGGAPDRRFGDERATLRGSIRRKPERHYLAFARAESEPDEATVMPLADQCSSLVRIVAEANALVVAPPGTETIRDGERVDVEPIVWNSR